MKKNLMGLFIASLVLSGCSAQTSEFNPKPLPALPETYRTPYQEAAKTFERNKNPSAMPYSKKPYFS